MRLVPVTLVLAGCMGGGVAGDGLGDGFGGNGAKADGAYSTCQLAEVLKFVNESTTTKDALEGIGLSAEASAAIASHKNGPDGQAGTGDDDLFDDLDELDKVSFVGSLALGHVVEAILPRCEVDLDTRPFIDSATFAGSTGGGWTRDNQEVEVVLGVSGITGQKLRELLLNKDSGGRTLYERLRKSRAMEAFSYGYSLDEIPWDGDTQDLREQLPYVSLTIEDGRYEPDPEDGVRKISLGTDLMDDSYFDTPAYNLLSNDVELRGRARWDDPTNVRRLLIAAKFGTEVDEAGNKTNAKVDIRNDSGASFVSKLDDDVRRGKTAWNGSDAVAPPVKGVYEQMVTAHVTQDIGMHTGVLLLDAKAHLRSTRSRYHMNETSIDEVRSVFRNGTTRITQALAAIDKAQAAGTIPASETARIDALETLARAVLDKSLLAQRITAAGVDMTAANLVLPDAQQYASTPDDLAKNKIIAETISAVYHELAQQLDDADRILTGATDEDFDAYAEAFMAWRKSEESSLKVKQTWDSFVNSYRSLSVAANRANALAAFNTYAQSKGLVPLTDGAWTRLGNYLDKMVLSVSERQIETAGIAATQLWFDQARQLWVPGSYRAYSNFMIDTTDMVDMLSNEEWLSIPETERTFAQPLPAAKVFNTVLVNEMQVELGMEAAYVARIKDLTEKLAMNPGDAAVQQQLDGAKWVWEQYTGAMKVLTDAKGENVLKKLKKEGAPGSIKWTAPPDSKGNQALKILSDRD